MLHYEVPCRPWEVVDPDVLEINNKTLHCIVHYCSKFPILKKVNSHSADDLVKMTKQTFAEYLLPKKIVSDVDTNCQSEMFKYFCKQMSI